MSTKDRIELFLKYQSENMSFEDISKKLNVKPTTIRRSLNKYGYKSRDGVYVKAIDESQISFEDIKDNSKSNKSKSKVNNNTKKDNNKKTKKVTDTKIVENRENTKEEKVVKKKVKPKKDRKINISQEDMDKLCEVYDWYIQIKDNKYLQPKKSANKKDILIEKENIKDVKSVNIRVDKETWEDFERLCSNSSFNKKEIITQALKDFMKTYKNLL